MEIPVYLFTGFLEAGKTRFLQEALSDKSFFDKGGERTLVLLCEEGEEELDPAEFVSPDVFVEKIENERWLNPDKLEALRRKHNANRVMIEYNGMWLGNALFEALPDDWYVFQEMMQADATTIEVYNANMRNLVVDKLSTCDLVVFNRCEDDTDTMALHKLVRAISRRTNIIYEKSDGTASYDTIEDPLPFDVNAPVIDVEDRDYALLYRDLAENMDQYQGKTVRFLGQVSLGAQLPKGGFIIGRPIMTCCIQDTTFSGLFSENDAELVSNGDWVRVTAKLDVKKCRVYGGRKGPVLKTVALEPAAAPEDPVATFY
ncbi:MAG: GTPase [Clostridia bacterium]|nr:GTPase [Clostridia bacterium]